MHSLGRRDQAVKVWLYADAGTSSGYKYNLLSFLALAWERVCVVGLGAVYWPGLTALPCNSYDTALVACA